MNNRYSLQEIAGMLAKKTGKPKADSERFLKILFSYASESLCKNKLVKIKGLGAFKLVIVKERESINVNTGERFIIPKHYSFLYQPDKELRELVNEPFSFFETTELTGETVSETEKTKEPEYASGNDTVNEKTTLATPIKDTEVKEEAAVIKHAKPRKKNLFTGALLILTVILLGVFIYFHSAGFFDVPPVEQSPEAEVTASILPADTHNATSAEEPEILRGEDLPPAMPNSSGILGTDTIVEGSRLTLISLKYYRHKKFWVYIYEYNREIISNPNQINIGTVIKIPLPETYGIDAADPASVEKARQLEERIISNL